MSGESKPARVQSSGRGKWLLLVAAMVVLGAVVCSLRGPERDDFEVNGIPFRKWVAHHPDFFIWDPLAQVGTNAIPHLIRIIQEPEESTNVYQVKKWIWNHLPQHYQASFSDLFPIQEWQLKRTALFGLRAFGPEARVALPDILKVGRSNISKMAQASTLVAALAVAPESPDTVKLWRDQWDATNFSRRDLAIYLQSACRPFPGAVPLLLDEAKRIANPIDFMEAFEFFGEAARPAVPDMLPILTNRLFRGNVLRVFLTLGPVASDAVPDLGDLLSDPSPDVVAASLQALDSIGPDARPALPLIQPLLTNDDSTIAMLAASASAHIQGKPELAVPALIQILEDPTLPPSKAYVEVRSWRSFAASGPQAAAILLGECGAAARPALPGLEKMLHDKSPYTRLFTAQAIWRITGSTNLALPALLDFLKSQSLAPQGGGPSPFHDDPLVIALQTIGEMGPAASNAIPTLRQACALSMAAHHAANAALLRIASPPN